MICYSIFRCSSNANLSRAAVKHLTTRLERFGALVECSMSDCSRLQPNVLQNGEGEQETEELIWRAIGLVTDMSLWDVSKDDERAEAINKWIPS